MTPWTTLRLLGAVAFCGAFIHIAACDDSELPPEPEPQPTDAGSISDDAGTAPPLDAGTRDGGLPPPSDAGTRDGGANTGEDAGPLGPNGEPCDEARDNWNAAVAEAQNSAAARACTETADCRRYSTDCPGCGFYGDPVNTETAAALDALRPDDCDGCNAETLCPEPDLPPPVCEEGECIEDPAFD